MITALEKDILDTWNEYQKNPFDVGCLLKFNYEMRNKSRKDENGQWIKLPDQEPWLVNYLVNVDL